MDTVREGQIERVALTYMHYHVKSIAMGSCSIAQGAHLCDDLEGCSRGRRYMYTHS